MDSYGLIHEDWTCYGFIWIQMKLRWNYMDHYGFVCDCASPKMYGHHNCQHLGASRMLERYPIVGHAFLWGYPEMAMLTIDEDQQLPSGKLT